MTREKIIEALAKIISAATLGKTSTRGGIDAATAVLELMRPKRLEWQRGAAVSANGTKYIVAETDFDDGAGEIWYIYVNGKAAGKLGQHNSDHSAQTASQAHADAAMSEKKPTTRVVINGGSVQKGGQNTTSQVTTRPPAPTPTKPKK